MKVQKKVSVQGQFVKLGEDIRDGDVVTIMDGGTVVQGKFGAQTVFTIRVPSGEDRISAFNQTSINNLVDAYSDETSQWIDKEVKVWLLKALVSGKLQTIKYFAPEDWSMDDDGQFVNPNGADKF